MKLPSCTVRTRSFVGSKINVSVTVERRDASVTDRGIVYGPPPTRNGVLGGEMMICAAPTPGDVVGTGGCAGCGGAGGSVGGVTGDVTGGVVGGVGSGGTTGVGVGVGCAGAGWTAT